MMTVRLFAIGSVLMTTNAFATGITGDPTRCADKIEAIVEAYLQVNDPNGAGYKVTASLLTNVFEDMSAPEDRNLQLWRVREDGSKEGLPVAFSYAVTRGEGSSACTIVKLIRGK